MCVCFFACNSADEDTPTATSVKADIDLSVLTPTVAYSQIYNISYNPDSYIGKTIKVKGTFATYDSGVKVYFACLVGDATACCQQAIEFVLAEERTFPDDYPAVGEEITVMGKFDLYTEGKNQYCYLTEAVMY